MKKLLILFVFILGCKTSQQNYLVDDDYKIIQVLLDRHARVSLSNLENDSYLHDLLLRRALYDYVVVCD